MQRPKLQTTNPPPQNRRKFQKTGNLFYKLQKPSLKSHSQTYRRSSKSNIAGKLANIKKTDHTLWQTFNIISLKETRENPVLQNPTSHTFHYTNKEKAERLAVNFEKIHNFARNTTSPIEHDIERLAALSPKPQHGR